MSNRPRYAIIPTTGRACLKDCLMAIQPQVDKVILVYTVPFTEGELHADLNARVLCEDRNISSWWNLGLQIAEEDRGNLSEPAEQWDVAILNDDAIVSEDWFERISRGMRRHGGAAASSGARHGITEVLTEPGPVPGWPNPLQGFAFMLAGEKGLRANEDLHWYFTDNYIDWESRKLGGTVILPVCSVQHLYPNGQMDHALQIQSAADAQTFVDLYGMRPW